MLNFELYNPVKVIFGAGEVKRVGEQAAGLGKNCLLVSYKDHSYMADLLASITTDLEGNGITVTSFYEASVNPTLKQVEAGVEICRSKDIDMIVAVGGGSAMDCAKAIAGGKDYKGHLWDMVATRHDEWEAVFPETALPTLMVPTMPATSSEMNSGSVITNTETKEKSYIFTDCLFPKVSILDPELTCTLPTYQTAAGVADAISHVLELYLVTADNAPVQERFMEGIVGTLMNYVDTAIENPNDVDARTQIQWAACVAWNGWTIPGSNPTHAMHFIAHPLSGIYNTTHGATLAVVMCAFMKYNYKTNLDRYVQFAEKIMGIEVDGRDQEEVALEAIAKFEAFLKRIGVETTLSECNIPESDIPTIVDAIAKMYFSADGVLVSRKNLSREDVTNILKLAV